ncbi:metallophosphoesterase [Rhizobium halophytocola]|uniref:3',5'-cyclic AMP phosphodiesterase CpdA n=1 Tax=Rhizobium halophytocola TaxID=735519 RepID=A0ABS4DWV8_9HYPH|nr:metallophosphoesterase [Rhizobium halophytocola]MBP1850178.1 3',5'-cyclic AMP phosphodiesterase CpdA [Rhizobium halophytocola]
MTVYPARPPLRFGVIADPQFADVPPSREHDRFYGRSLGKIAEAVGVFAAEGVDFVVTLGDLIDRDFVHLAPVLSLYEKLACPHIVLPGNHDFQVEADRKGAVHATLGMPAPFYSRAIGGIRFVVIDTTEIALFSSNPGEPRHDAAVRQLEQLRASGAPQAMDWNAAMSAEQVIWLAETLADAERAGERAIVFGHYPLFPLTDHSLWNAGEVASVIARSPAAIAYFCGHDHRGNYGRKGTTHFLNMHGMVDTETQNAFAIVTVGDDRIEIEGFGRQVSRTLRL